MFTWVDYTVFGSTIALSLVIGVYYAVSGGRQKTTSEYLMADRSFSVLPVSLSMSVSYISSLSLLGDAAEMHYHGVTYILRVVGMGIGMALAGFCAVPVLYPLHLTSLNEYLVHRFDSQVLLCASWLWQVIRQIVYSGIVIYGPAVMFEAMSGFPTWASVLLIGLASTFYTTIGGFKAVVWTDVFQSAVMFGGVIVILIRGLILTNGDEAFRTYNDEHRTQFTIDPSPFVRQSVWTMLLTGVLFGYASYAVSQSGTQRLCALKSVKDARRAVLLSVFFRMGLEALCVGCGVVTFAYYTKRGCDPLKAGYIKSPNQILPHFVMDELGYWGIPGLFVAAVFSGSLSTVSSNLNGIAAITWEDLLSKRFRHWSELAKARAAKIICLCCGVVSILIGVMTAKIGGTLMQITSLLASLTLSPLLLVFICGALIPRINWKSMLAGSLLSTAMAGWLIGGSLFLKTHQDVLPLSDRNCSRKDVVVELPWSANATEGYIVNADSGYTSAGFITTQQTVPGEDGPGINIIYQISPFLILPIVLGICMIITPLLTLLPGCSFAGKRRPELFFPCIRQKVKGKSSAMEEYKMVGKNPDTV